MTPIRQQLEAIIPQPVLGLMPEGALEAIRGDGVR
jgi:hypothetical protein